ncbi:MAG: phosphoglycerate kinase [Firmicutes bacterium]|nr:phosphoglycerate kinase [Bacillota bacterium]
MAKKTVKDIDVKGKRVLVRVDFNVPLNDDGQITDDNRIRAALATIRYLLDREARLILMSHLGRPKGEPDDKMRMDPVAKRLEDMLDRPVTKVDDCIGEIPRAAVADMRDGDVVLLENLRFHPGEKKNDDNFARQLAELGEVYVNDAFGTAHRAHASTQGVTEYLLGVAGFLLEKEINMLSKVVDNPERPYVAIIGGAKVSDKIGVLDNLIGKVDSLIIGGGMANTFLKAKGYELGKSLLEEDKVDTAKELIGKAEQKGIKLLLPVDLVVAPGAEPSAESKVVSADAVPEEWMALDIGPETAQIFGNHVKDSSTVVWNGPMGVFEMELFARGTIAVAQALAESGAVTVVGGGDSASAVKKAGVTDRITHVSTGGGASLEFLEGKTLPGVASLQDKEDLVHVGF